MTIPFLSNPYPIEYQLDSEGNRIRRALGYELTASSRAARHRYLTSLHHHTKPLDHLPPNYFAISQKKGCNPPRFNFGFGVPTQLLYDYAFKHGLVPENYRGNPRATLPTIRAAVKELDRACGAKLSLQAVGHAEYNWVVTRYSNYTWQEDRLKEKEEERVMDFLRTELHIADTPRWYEDIVDRS